MRRSLAISILGVAFFGCGTDYVEPDTEPTAKTTWFQHVAPIVADHCMGCHQEGGIGPFELTTYNNAVEHAAMMVDAVDRGIMPPFDAREEADCTPRHGWQDDPRLTAAEKDTLRAWVDGGYEKGIDDTIEIPETPELENVSTTLTPAQGFVTSGTRDQFMCFVMDPGNTTFRWVTGLQVRPDNDLVVHHAVITQVEETEGNALIAEHGLGTAFECDTTPGSFVMHVWTPGNQPMRTPSDLAIPLAARSKIVMQIHYHPAGGTHAPDATQIDLQYSTVWPRKMYFVTAIGNELAAPNLEPGPGDGATPRFFIPANSADHTEKMFRDITTLGGLTNVKLYSVNPHMHLVGTKISSKIHRPSARGDEPQTECLANGGWNFDWQRTYTYDADIDDLPSIEVGDRISVSCGWNNTMDNPFVERMLHDSNLPPQPIDITLGEQTTQEMCLEIFGIATDAPAQPLLATDPVVLPDLRAIDMFVR
ncbi:MAG: hypothetical protein ACKV2T_02955 [Kofleriaceae bacterium]